LQTLANQTDSTSISTKKSRENRSRDQQAKEEAELWDAVTYLTMLLNEAYPAQFARAFPRDEDRERARGVWVAALRGYSPKRIKKAAQKVIRSGNTFMPNLGNVIQLCQLSYEEMGLKRPLQAYFEACNAESQRFEASWSHPAVYFAAKMTGWFVLKSEPQSKIFPVFEYNYKILCQRVQDGDDLTQDIAKCLEDFSKRDVFYQTEQQVMKTLREIMQKQGIKPDAGRRAFEEIMEEF